MKFEIKRDPEILPPIREVTFCNGHDCPIMKIKREGGVLYLDIIADGGSFINARECWNLSDLFANLAKELEQS